LDVILANAGIHGFPPQPALDLIGGVDDELKVEPARLLHPGDMSEISHAGPAQRQRQ